MKDLRLQCLILPEGSRWEIMLVIVGHGLFQFSRSLRDLLRNMFYKRHCSIENH